MCFHTAHLPEHVQLRSVYIFPVRGLAGHERVVGELGVHLPHHTGPAVDLCKQQGILELAHFENISGLPNCPSDSAMVAILPSMAARSEIIQ